MTIICQGDYVEYMKIKKVINAYRDVLAYIFFGVCTTVVNIVAYWIVAHLLNGSTTGSTIIAWIVAVLFAYVTNRKWVFQSSSTGYYCILKEMMTFFLCRLTTGLLDVACMYVFVDLLQWNDMVVKCLSNLAVIVLNYVASKLIIFNNTSRR